MGFVLQGRRILALLCLAALLLALATTSHPDSIWALPAPQTEFYELIDLVRAPAPAQPELPPQPLVAQTLSPRAPPLV